MHHAPGKRRVTCFSPKLRKKKNESAPRPAKPGNRPKTGWIGAGMSSTSKKISSEPPTRPAVLLIVRPPPQAPNRPAGCRSQYIQAVPVRLLMDDNLLRVFIALTAVAVVVQAGILVALYLAVRKSAARMEALATEVTTKALPTLETAQSML